MDDTGTSPDATIFDDLSEFGRGKGWLGWKCCDGSLSRDLRNYQRPWNMVSDQSAVCWIFPGKNHHRTNRRFSLGRADHCDDHPPALLRARRASLRRRPSHVSTPRDSPGM